MRPLPTSTSVLALTAQNLELEHNFSSQGLISSHLIHTPCLYVVTVEKALVIGPARRAAAAQHSTVVGALDVTAAAQLLHNCSRTCLHSHRA